MPLGHLGLNVPDLTAARAYYDAVLPLLGYETFFVRDDEVSYKPAADRPGCYLFLYPTAEPGAYSRHRTGLQHLAFIVHTRAEVDAALEAARGLGSEVVHEPREWPQYHTGYYGGFWLDPHGVMLEAVCHHESDG